MATATPLQLGLLAIKGNRFFEAENIYSQLLNTSDVTEAWCGLGLSKLGKLLFGKSTINEVLYCLDQFSAQANEQQKKNGAELVISASAAMLDTAEQLVHYLRQRENKLKSQKFAGLGLRAVSMLRGGRPGMVSYALSGGADLRPSIFTQADSLLDSREGNQLLTDAAAGREKVEQIYSRLRVLCKGIQRVLESSIDAADSVSEQLIERTKVIVAAAEPSPNPTLFQQLSEWKNEITQQRSDDKKAGVVEAEPTQPPQRPEEPKHHNEVADKRAVDEGKTEQAFTTADTSQPRHQSREERHPQKRSEKSVKAEDSKKEPTAYPAGAAAFHDTTSTPVAIDAAERKFRQICPDCGTSYLISSTNIGRRVKCGKCGNEFRLAASKVPPLNVQNVAKRNSAIHLLLSILGGIFVFTLPVRLHEHPERWAGGVCALIIGLCLIPLPWDALTASYPSAKRTLRWLRWGTLCITLAVAPVLDPPNTKTSAPIPTSSQK